VADRSIDHLPSVAPRGAGRGEPPPLTRAPVAGSRQGDRAAFPSAPPRSSDANWVVHPGPNRSVPSGANWVVQPGTDRAARRTPPPRPAVAVDLSRPIAAAEAPCPRAVRISAWLWFAACAVGSLGGLAALADGNALRDRLAASARASEPAATTAVIDDAVLTTVLVVLGAVATLVVLTVVWTAFLLRRRSWARWLLLVTGLLTLFAGDVALSLVTGGADMDRIGLLSQMLLLVPAMGLLVARSSRAWLRPDAG